MTAVLAVVDGTQVQVDARRRLGVSAAVAHLRGGRPGRAYYELVRSVQEQARLAGIPVSTSVCSCGGRCPKGGGGR